jgi:hypothetical protein
MTTPHAYWLVLWGRAKCRFLNRHNDITTTVSRYRMTWCSRCYRPIVEVVR